MRATLLFCFFLCSQAFCGYFFDGPLHPYAIHKPSHITLKGDLITLDDGSVWSVRYEHHYLVQNWLGSDPIVLVPNRKWFAYYRYKLMNTITEDKVEALMLVAPHYNGKNSHWIVAIDYLNRQICLEDGTIWQAGRSSSSILNGWEINQTVIVGYNDFKFFPENYIFFNTDKNEHIEINLYQW